jgi:hypothetical protein
MLIEAAISAGFDAYDRNSDGWLVRKFYASRWHFALVRA